MRALVGATALAFLFAGAAYGHEGGPHTGFAARVSVIEPFLPGLLVQVLGGHERLSAANLSDVDVVILDDRGLPLVRIPAGTTEVWADPRIGATEDPPEEEGLVRNWRIRALADGEPFEIRGFLGYRPPVVASAPDEASVPGWAIGLALAAVAAVLCFALLAVIERRERQEQEAGS
jgi:hypothetical protein